MNRFRPRTRSCFDDTLLYEIALGRRSGAEQVRLVSHSDVQRSPVRLRVHGDRRDPQLAQGAEDPNRDLTTIGDEHLREACHDRRIVSVWARPIS
jgi:hypothetical protein